jgi:DNA-binding NarL/FixJ family response regulator
MKGPAQNLEPVFATSILMANLPVMLCELLHQAFDAVADITVAEPINDVRQMLDVSQHGSADIILLGSSKAENMCSAIAILESLPDRHKNAKAVILTEDPDYEDVTSLFRSGAKGIFCTADLKFDLLCKSIRCVQQGQIWVKNELIAHLVSSLSMPKSRDVTDSQGKPLLTTREQQVLHLLADGLSNYELATVLRLSEHTIKNHLFRIYDKLGVSNRMEAVLYALSPRNTLTSRPRPLVQNSQSNIRMIKTG